MSERTNASLSSLDVSTVCVRTAELWLYTIFNALDPRAFSMIGTNCCSARSGLKTWYLSGSTLP